MRVKSSPGAHRRKRLARLHVALGVIATVYILFVSLSGCALLFERELYAYFSPHPDVVFREGALLGVDDLKQAAARQYPLARVVNVWTRQFPAQSVAEIWLEHDGVIDRRLFHPYTGADLGNVEPIPLRLLAAVREAHLHLMAGAVGRAVNGLGAFALLLLAVSGSAIWRRRPPASQELAAKRRLYSFHATAGVLFSFFAALWGITGMALALPTWLSTVLGESRTTDTVFRWLYGVHTAGIDGGTLRPLWAAAALGVTALAASGLMIWIRRRRRRGSARAQAYRLAFNRGA